MPTYALSEWFKHSKTVDKLIRWQDFLVILQSWHQQFRHQPFLETDHVLFYHAVYFFGIYFFAYAGNIQTSSKALLKLWLVLLSKSDV